jgi:hypothetical protein
MPPLRASLGGSRRIFEWHPQASVGVGCVVLGTLLSAVVQGLGPTVPHIEDPANHSAVARAVGFGRLAGLYMLLAYAVQVWSLHRLARRWQPRPSRSLWLAALLLAGLWFVGSFEGVFDGEAYVDLLGLALGHSVPIVIALGLFARLSSRQGRPGGLPTAAAASMGTFLAMVSVAALSAWVRFGVMDIASFHSGKTIHPVGIKVWTLALGLFLGVAYAVWMHVDAHLGAIERSLRFVFVLFGTNWLVFNLFYPLMLTESLIDFLLFRWAFDVLAVLAGTLIAELVVWQMKVPQS